MQAPWPHKKKEKKRKKKEKKRKKKGKKKRKKKQLLPPIRAADWPAVLFSVCLSGGLAVWRSGGSCGQQGVSYAFMHYYTILP